MSRPPQEQVSADITLRAHHLLCALSFRGRGYGPDFVLTFKQLIDQLVAGQSIRLTSHADSLCNTSQNCGQCKKAQSVQRDKLALESIARETGIESQSTFRLEPKLLEQLRRAFADGSLRSACTNCAWFDYCSSVAEDNFRRARLQLPR